MIAYILVYVCIVQGMEHVRARVRSEMAEALPGFCRRTHMPVANRFSQAASYTRTWGTWRYACLFKKDQVVQSLSTQARTQICRPKRFEDKYPPAKHANRYSPPHAISISSRLELREPTLPAAYSLSREHAMASVDRFGAVAISLERTTRHLTRGRCMRVRSSQCPAVRAICQVSIPHVRAVELY
jgi:hypothetical protein